MESQHDSASLDVLRCPDCNAPVPLGTADAATCPYCNQAFDIPERYRSLRDAEREKALGRTEALALYARLGRPPGIIARAWGGVATGCIWLFVWPIAFVVDALLIAKLLEAASGWAHASLYEVLPNKVVWTGIGGLLYATLAVPLAIGIYGNRRTNGVRRLQAALASLPPDRKGGPARCRACQAPLEVRPDDVGLACIYCGADNLVRMPEDWVASLRKTAKRLDSRIETIGREDREMRAKERRSLRRQLAWLSVFVVLLFVFGIALDRDANQYPPSWRVAIAAPRALTAAVAPTAPYDTFIPPPVDADGRIHRVVFDRSERKSNYSIRSYLLPLRAGETVSFGSGDYPDGARALGFTFRMQMSAVFGDDWRQVGKDVILLPNGSGRFVAPTSGWYRVDMMIVDDLPPGLPFEMSVAVSKEAA